MRGIIENIEERIAVKGNKYLVIFINKLKFSVFDNELFKILKTGAEIEYEIETKGKYKNIKDVKLIKGVLESAVSDTAKPSVSNHTDINASIELQVCFKGAIELYKDKTFKEGGFEELIIESTKTLYKEIFQDQKDKSPEISKMMSQIIAKMTEVKGLFGEEEFTKSRDVIENYYNDYDRIKKLYDWIEKEYEARLDLLKKENEGE